MTLAFKHPTAFGAEVMPEPKHDKDGRELLPVFAEDEAEPIGYAADKAGAARIFRKHAAETVGDGDTGITAELVNYDRERNGWKLSD